MVAAVQGVGKMLGKVENAQGPGGGVGGGCRIFI
jgi:hypothetical protein